MNFRKHPVYTLAVSLFLLLGLSGCGAKTPVQEPRGDKITVIATLFPQYDFAREIAGDAAGITLLLPPGAESHSYEPSPSDMMRISDADLFLYTGDQMETWVPKLLSGLGKQSNVRVVDVSKGLTLLESGPEPHEEHGDHPDHDAGFDPHIWTSPVMAKQMVQNITDAFCEIDPAHGELYTSNNSAYQQKLDALDGRFREIVRQGKRSDFIFASRFACRYFAQEYGLNPDSPYDSCSAETEPGAQAMARVIDHVKASGVPVVFYQELTDKRVAKAVSEATGAEPLLFHSCHNVSKDDFQKGVTYLSLMEQNAKNLEKGLG